MKLLVVAGLLTVTGSAAAQTVTPPPPTQGRANENAVRQAEDAFGVSIGNEAIGLYNSFDVSDFSPTRAGNVRIDGLYFDQVWPLNSRIRRSMTIRVGISATRDNAVFLPDRTLVDIGGRYAFKLSGKAANVRLGIRNLFDVNGFDLRGAGSYDLIDGRVATLRLAVDI